MWETFPQNHQQQNSLTNMAYTKKQTTALQQADIKLRKTVEHNLIKAANQISLPIHYLEIMFLSSETERIAAAGVVNCGHYHAGEATDILFLYLNVPGIKRDFYRVQIMPLSDGDFAQKAALVDMDGQVVKELRFLMIDPVGGVFGNDPAKKVFRPSIEGWLNRKSEYILFGALEAGKPFVVAIEK